VSWAESPILIGLSLARVDVDLSCHEVKEVALVAGWLAPDVALPVAQ